MINSVKVIKIVEEFARKIGRLKCNVDLYHTSRETRFILEDEITGANHSFAIDGSWDDDAVEKMALYQLNKLEDAIYIDRGKHITKSYGLYERVKYKAFPSKYSIGSKEYAEEYIASVDNGTEVFTPTTPAYEDLRKQLEEERVSFAEEKEQKAKERKEAYNGNSEFGTF